MAIPGVEMHDYRKKSLFDRAKEALAAHQERQREERPARVKEWKEKTKELRAEAGYRKAERSLNKSRGGGGMGGFGGGGDIGDMFLGTQGNRKPPKSDFGGGDMGSMLLGGMGQPHHERKRRSRGTTIIIK